MNFSDLKIGERLKSLEYVYLKIDDYWAVNVDSLVVISIDPDCEVDKVPKWSDELTNIERGVLLELVYSVIESIQTDGADRPDNPAFVGYCSLYRKLGGTPPEPIEPELTPAARQSAIGLADDLIDIARNAGGEDD